MAEGIAENSFKYNSKEYSLKNFSLGYSIHKIRTGVISRKTILKLKKKIIKEILREKLSSGAGTHSLDFINSLITCSKQDIGNESQTKIKPCSLH